MSCVAWRDGIMAGDARAYGGSWQPSPGQKTKIHMLDDGTKVGITSAVIGMPERFIKWLRTSGNVADWGSGNPDCRVLMVKPSGDIYFTEDSLHFAGPIKSEFYAIGSGAGYAMGAFAMGATAEEAVKAACLFDNHCAEPVMTL